MICNYILYIVLAIMAIAFWNEKGSWLFAGYNVMSDKEKQTYNHKKLCRVMGCCVGTVDMLLVISDIMRDNEKLKNIFIVLAITVVIVTVILSNTVCRENRNLRR